MSRSSIEELQRRRRRAVLLTGYISNLREVVSVEICEKDLLSLAETDQLLADPEFMSQRERMRERGYRRMSVPLQNKDEVLSRLLAKLRTAKNGAASLWTKHSRDCGPLILHGVEHFKPAFNPAFDPNGIIVIRLLDASNELVLDVQTDEGFIDIECFGAEWANAAGPE